MAIKTIIFSCSPHAEEAEGVAREAAIASSLCHPNVVATYSHDVLGVTQSTGAELGICKFYLIQVRPCSAGEKRTVCWGTTHSVLGNYTQCTGRGLVLLHFYKSVLRKAENGFVMVLLLLRRSSERGCL